MWRRLTNLVPWIAAASTLCAPPIRADQSVLLVRPVVQRGEVMARVEATDIVDQALNDRLRSGISNRLVFEAKLVPEGLAPPVLRTEWAVEIVYDLWEEHFLVHDSAADTVRTFGRLQELVVWLNGPHLVALGPASSCLPARRYRIEATLRVNPVPQHILEQSRDLSSPASGQGEISQSRSLFGSVARIFFNVSADQGVRTLRGRSSHVAIRPEQEP